MSGYEAIVKEVLSGDTLVLVGRPKNGPPPEIQLSLASLSAPRLQRGPNGQRDEPFAWASREFLRKACIGKLVTFKIEYQVASINRKFGAVWLKDGSIPENLCVAVAREGWARVREAQSQGGDSSTDIDEMLAASKAAQAAGRGLFTSEAGASEASIRNVKWSVENPESLVGKGPQRVVIEYIRDGASMKVMLLSCMTQAVFNLAGVQCPRVRPPLQAPTGDDGEAPPKPPETGPAPFALEAQYFTATRLLNREVNLILEGVDKFGNFFGTVEHPAGNISVMLVKNGLGRCVDWSLGFTTTANAIAIRSAEKEAKAAHLRIWKDYVAPHIPGETKYEGIVAEVASADTLVIRVGGTDEEPWEGEQRRITLSSIRCPRLGSRARLEPPAPWAREALEMTRSKLIGKKVNVSVEYLRGPPINKETGEPGKGVERRYGTVMVPARKGGKKNFAVMLLAEGLAEAVRHRSDDERSEYYDELLAAESEARAAGKGVHSTVEPPPFRSLDLVGQGAKAKSQFEELNRLKKPKAVVEYCYNGARMKVWIKSESIYVNFALAGINCPMTGRRAVPERDGRPARPATEDAEFSQEALAFTRSVAMQREVELEIETMDRGGTLIGSIFIKGKGGSKNNLALMLLDRGLARVVPFSAQQSSYCDHLFAAEHGAKHSKLRVWKDFDAAKEEAEKAARAAEESPSKSSRGLESKRVMVSEVVNAGSLYIQFLSDDAKADLASVQAIMQEVGESVGLTAEANKTNGGGLDAPKKKTECLALFDNGDGPAWYRARVEYVEDGGTALRVRYIDYGNVEVIPVADGRLRSPPIGAFAIKDLAKKASLALVKVPDLESEYGREAALCTNSLVWNKPLNALIHVSTARDDPTDALYVTLYADELDKADSAGTSIAADAIDGESTTNGGDGADDAGSNEISGDAAASNDVNAPSAENVISNTEKENALSVNEMLLMEGLATVVEGKARPRRLRPAEETLLKAFAKAQKVAHKGHYGMWRYGDAIGDQYE